MRLLGLEYGLVEKRLCADEEATWAFASALASQAVPGARIALTGDLGAGKTTWVKGLARALGLPDAVHSPTYALMHAYGRPERLVHLDLYRLGDGADLAELGLDEALSGGAWLCIEWPERLPEGTAFDHWVHMTWQAAETRLIEWRAPASAARP